VKSTDRFEAREVDIAADHVERGVAQDLLEAEYVAAVDEIAARERVAERVWAAAGPDELASGCVETAETVSVDVDQAVELVPGGVLVEGTKRRRTLPVF
jgi:hypothetical protein